MDIIALRYIKWKSGVGSIGIGLVRLQLYSLLYVMNEEENVDVSDFHCSTTKWLIDFWGRSYLPQIKIIVLHFYIRSKTNTFFLVRD